MQIDDACLVERTVQPVDVIGELDAVMSNHIGGATHGSCRIVAVFCYLIACAGNDETGGGRDVEGVFAVATRTYYIDIAVAVEDGWYACFQNAIAETQEFFYGYTSHLQTRQQRCNLFVGIFTLSDTNQNGFHLLTGEFFVVQQPKEVAFHCLFHNIWSFGKLSPNLLKKEPVLNHFFAIGCQHTFRVELDAANVQFIVTQRHDLPHFRRSVAYP